MNPSITSKAPRGLHPVVEDTTMRVTTPEGTDYRMPIEALPEEGRARLAVADGIVLPRDVVMFRTRGSVLILVYESTPCVRGLRWIAADSPAPYGPGASYRQVALALPYVVVLAVFQVGRNGAITLTSTNEAFFRNAPLRNLDDELCFPALLNCSKFESETGNPLSWICTEHLPRDFDAEPDPARRVRRGLAALVSCLYETGFNYSSEHHEASSWFTESRGVDPRVATVEAWEEASRADPQFPMEVPWLPTGRSLREVTERIFRRRQAEATILRSASDLARLVVSRGEEVPPAGGEETSAPDPF